jgi:non-specific serine/threonine protein kinase
MFQLVDPPEGDGSWRLAILLQSAVDPSLRLPAADVWRGRGAARALGKGVEDPQEQLLAGLGRASRLYPPLVAALDESHPTGIDLDAVGAHAFLRDAAPLLIEAGFGVLLPGWWRASRRRLGVRARARSKSEPGNVRAGLGLESIAEVDWEIALGDSTISEEQLRELAAAKAPLVRIRGEWVELLPGELEAATRLMGRTSGAETHQELTTQDVLRLAWGLEAGPQGLTVEGVTADGWLGGLLAAGDDTHPTGRRPPRPRAPEGFSGTLRPYQLRGLAWLESLDSLDIGACLADDMGLGKTAQLIGLLVAEREAAGRGSAPRRPIRPGPTLVVCPMSVVGNWQRELARFAPGLTVHIHHGPDRGAIEEVSAVASSVDAVLTTYGLVHRDRDALAAIEWERIVLDEAGAIKNSAARQSQAVRSLRARSRIALTGTPVENRLSELWSIMEFLNPGLLGSANAFRTRFAVPIERYRDADAAATLRRVTAPFVLRRLKSDRSIIRDLPEKIETQVDCRLTREQASLYQAVVDEMLGRVESSEGIERRGHVLTTMLRLKQVCNHPAHLLGDGSALAGRSGKLARLEELLEEVLAEGDRALLFTQFAEFGGMLRSHLRDRFRRDVLYLQGSTPRRDRDAMVARFESRQGPSLFVLSLKAGGIGLNLTAANHVFHVDRWWNPAVEDQATDRAYRIGQKRTVQVHKLVCTGTLEERIAALIASKRELADMVVGAGERWLTELSNAELRELVTLGSDAIDDGEGPP